MTQPCPSGYHSLTPYLIVREADKALRFYEEAFGAVETMRLNMPGTSTVAHAETRIGDSVIMVGEESPNMQAFSPAHFNGTPMSLFFYVEDVDAAFRKAAAAGATVRMKPTDMFWGDRVAKLTDPFGHEWTLGQHMRDVSLDECQQKMQELYGSGDAGCANG